MLWTSMDKYVMPWILARNEENMRPEFEFQTGSLHSSVRVKISFDYRIIFPGSKEVTSAIHNGGTIFL